MTALIARLSRSAHGGRPKEILYGRKVIELKLFPFILFDLIPLLSPRICEPVDFISAALWDK